jgi:group I intron endonuclease
MGIIYRVTNNINSKSYVGQSIFSTIKNRKRDHWNDTFLRFDDLKFHRALKKHGFENFNWEIIDNCDNDKLDEREIYWISFYDSFKKGYNSTLGGQGNYGHKFNKKQIKKLSIAVKKSRTPEVRKKIGDAQRGSKHHQFGKPLKAETKRKLSISLTGRKHTEETKRKISDAQRGSKHHQFGKPLSDEIKEKIRISTSGSKNHNYGKQKSEEVRRKISESEKGKVMSLESRQKMSKNSTIKKKVMCVETGNIYNSIKEASILTNSYAQTIGACIAGKRKSTNKLHWELVN